MLAVVAQNFSSIQWRVLSSYCRAFADRGLPVKLVAPSPGSYLLYEGFYVKLELAEAGRYVISNGSTMADKRAHCFWIWNDLDNIEPEAEGCAFVLHHGPRQEIAATDRRLLLLPRNDLFEIRGIANTVEGWADYRSRIAVPWEDKQPAIYFAGSFTGAPDASNSRLLALLRLRESGLPCNVGFLRSTIPDSVCNVAPAKDPEPLHEMARYRFVLSLWGNHPFNPRLYRGLEGGSLVFHQATPHIRFLDDGILRPGRDYVEIASDLSNLTEQVQYYLDHPAEAREIAEEGHRAWMATLYAESPYHMPDVVWDRLTSQPRWQEFLQAYNVWN
jgi:hypothetical protein